MYLSSLRPRSTRIVLCAIFFVLAACNPPIGEREPFPEGFIWGAASDGTAILGSAADHTGRLGLVRASRERIVQDIQLLKTMGVGSYRFNLDWDLLVTEPGTVDPDGLAYYEFLLDELADAGITAAATVYSGQLPSGLKEAGGWRNPATAEQLAALAETVFEALGDKVSTWITVDDPFERLVLQPARMWREDLAAADTTEPNPALSRAPPFVQARRRGQRPGALDMPGEFLTSGFGEMHQVLLAHARMVEAFRAQGLPGQIGIALGITPVYPAGSEGEENGEAARLVDGLYNRWALDGLLGGGYPDDVIAALGLEIDSAEEAYISQQGTDFLGVNYFGPVLASVDTTSMIGARVAPNPDRDRAFRGQVLPSGMSDALTRISVDYPGVPLIVTANGVGYGNLDELVEQSRVRDELRLRFMRRHIVQVQRAILAGAPVQAYYAWTAFDGADPRRREGLIYVDFETRERLFKDSARLYSGVVRSNSISRLPF